MKELIKKELIVYKYYFLIALIFIPIAYFPDLIDDKAFSYYFISFASSIFSIIIIVNSVILPREDHVEKLFLSLPLDRGHIIKSKYLVYSLYPILFSLIHFITYIFINFPSLRYANVNFDMVIIPVSFSLIVMGVMLPIKYIWTKKFRIIGFLFYMFIIMGRFTWEKWIGDYISYIGIFYGLNSLILLFIAITIYLLSMKISEFGYRKMLSRA